MSKRYFSIYQEAKPNGNSAAQIDIYGDLTSYPFFESDVSSYGLAEQIKGFTDVDEITVNINSYGGEVKEGVAIYNALKANPAKVTTVVDGFACSAASIVFCAGDERIMRDASLLMIHNAWSYAEGDANALRKQADDLDKLTEPSIKAYLSVSDLSEDEIREMMDNETWLDPDEALEMGFATSVVKSKASKNSQSVRSKVMQMLKNPYQLDEEDPEKDEDQPGTDETDDSTTDDGTDTGDTGTDADTDTDQQPDDGGEGGDGGEQPADDPENPDDDPEKDKEAESEQQVAQFLKAIFR